MSTRPGHAAALAGPNASVDLVIFDFDGVVADSEVISLTTLRESLKAHDLDLSLDEVRRRCLGVSVSKIAQMLVDENAAADVDRFRADWETRLFDRFRRDLKPVPGVVALLDRLTARDIAFCIASSGTHQRIGVALGAMGLRHRFAHVFSAEDVARGKPAPDLFRHAARSMNIRPNRCLVIEDSVFGVTAARAASMPVIGFLGGEHLKAIRDAHAAELSDAGAHTIVDSHTALFSAAKDLRGLSAQ
ncbi:HAD family hydrolase [Roseobacter sinensis]|uniref:HAD family phosphatase n=1 Tax=Roseobacter sinensis TaxID=2931391 RepID=A0ABT3BKJ7_9RHOB|nr:HAD family phosphatase [Roseobacter sp. WL0113]MCV3274096.1 HAD family phosphatase [Roseobacter sp. WL0113]